MCCLFVVLVAVVAAVGGASGLALLSAILGAFVVL